MKTEIAPERAQATPAMRSNWGMWRTGILVAGDALSFLAFASAGRNTHGEALSLGQIALTAVPFALSWFIVSPWLGAYRRTQTTGPLNMLKRTELAWISSYPLAIGLRVLFGLIGLAENASMPWTFALVILLANGLFLGAWRTLFAIVERYLPVGKTE
ncbi:MAG: DUF3054 domain-containing protein [Ktedonobacterales bacterium]